MLPLLSAQPRQGLEDSPLPLCLFAFLGFGDAELFDEVDLRTMLAFSHTPARLLRLLERQKPRRWPAASASKPKQDDVAP